MLLGGFALGSLVGSVGPRIGEAALSVWLCAATVPLVLPVGLWWLAALFVVAGAPVAPLNAIAYELTDRAAPAGTATEARMWTGTATAAGTALGSAAPGAVVDASAARSACLVALAGAVAAALASAAGRRRHAGTATAGVTVTVTGAATPPRPASTAASSPPAGPGRR
ncbi:hypothetical protein GCM10010399_93330 [Dactylosporangium fulvum]|uniref:hypothetical protein n=1 Tax=Dactylosporangium fulvum TaxID=53359 RepID=UPI0031DD01EA